MTTSPTTPVLARLRARRDRLSLARKRLVEDAVVHLVCLPERLPLAETARAVAVLEGAGLTVGALLVNRLLPSEEGDGFLRGLVDDQRHRLDELARLLPGRRLVTVAHLPRAPVRDDLADLGERLVAAGL